MNIVLIAGLFITFLLLIEIGYFIIRTVWNPEKKAIQKRMNALSVPWDQDESIDIQRKSFYSEIPWLNRILLKFSVLKRVKPLLEKSGLQYPLGVFVLSSLLLFLAGIIGGSLLTSKYLFILPVAVLLGMLPFLYICYRKEKRMQKFQTQLPEALDLLARSLKAGHAFTGGVGVCYEGHF